ncbi:MAG: ABC transporter ATP-binding protein [Patescibacteria group bacterium]
MAVLEVKNLTKKFGKFTAVDNISFELKEGEILGLLGPNGAGKTTTIDILLGLTKPTTGEIKIFDLPFEENREKILKQMNFSAAYVNLPWRLKVWENLYTFGRLYEVEDYKEKIEILIKEFQLFDLRNKLTDSLSSGQLTRLYLCKAFVNNPRLLLLDEPTAFLDPDISDLVRKYILNKVKTEKTSVLFTSHNMAEVTEICDRVIFLNKGKIVAEDTPVGLTKRIKFCKVRLFFDLNLGKAELLLKNYKYNFSSVEKEILVDIEEEKVGQLLGRLSLAKLKYSQITIEKPTLEHFFLEVIRNKNEN